MNNKLVLTDCDGVLLDWVKQFDAWMKHKGYTANESLPDEKHHRESIYGISKDESLRCTQTFNESAWIMDLQPINDAYHGVRKLKDKGYDFHVITAFGTDPYARQLRLMNLWKVFGDDAIDKFTGTDFQNITGGKRKALSHYRDSGLYWIEDRFESALLGLELGLKPILLDCRGKRHDRVPDGMERAECWEDILDIILDHT